MSLIHDDRPEFHHLYLTSPTPRQQPAVIEKRLPAQTIHRRPAAALRKPAAAFRKPAAALRKPAAAFRKPAAALRKPAAALPKPVAVFKKPASVMKPARIPELMVGGSLLLCWLATSALATHVAMD